MNKARLALSVDHATIEQAELLGTLLRDCLIELGASTEYPYLPLYWEEAGRKPYLFFIEGRVAGFALVREVARSVQEMAEFWVAPAYRRAGIGRAAALEIFRAHPGEWVVSSYPGNVAAEVFWREVIPEKGRSEHAEGNGSVYRFVTTDNMPIDRTT
ncbi:GNAT family N-acetyltransferase [Cupriavidus plantarum]|uniref:GNAT family N-acetyltransferase n=1 Tax=Cupriavidus plantarum TaxID=942865 RepID=UPI001BA5074E|nr:GNAT family N-acetyltransferase [Cupriavidus plantarum]SMR66410.1 Predicted acetyltransferase [Cupriavidus plantarum]